jgi:hypothetical protein
MADSFLKGTLLASLLFFTPMLFSKTIKVAFLDTGFCPEKSSIIYDPTNSIDKLDCKYIHTQRFHGEEVKRIFKANISKKLKVKIYDLILFDANGNQQFTYWMKAIEQIKKISADIVISAIGIPIDDKINFKDILLQGIWVLSVPHLAPKISREMRIFPQELNRENMFLVGNVLFNNQIDPGLFYLEDKKKIDFFAIEEENQSFKGSSFAVPKIAAKMLNWCGNNLLLSPFKKCLYQHTKILKDINQKEWKTLE